MRCYELNERQNVVRGISVTTENGPPRLWLPPAERPIYAPRALEYMLGFSPPLLSEEFAEKLTVLHSQPGFVVPDARLDRCDLEDRASLWAIPETEATRNCALILAVTLDGRPATWPGLYVVGDGSEILAQSPVTRNRSGQRLRGVAALVKLAPRGMLRITRQYRYRKMFGAEPKTEYTLQCLPDGTVQGFTRDHPLLDSEVKAVTVVPFRGVPITVPPQPQIWPPPGFSPKEDA